MGHFKNIYLVNFRNFEKYNLNFSNHCNVLFGKNGSGKTNILEGISLFSKGRGIRKDKMSNIIKKNYENFTITSNFQHHEIIYNLKSQTKKINNKIKKNLLINNDNTNETLTSFYKIFPFLTFLPETERLFISSPSNRRNFIDQLIFTYEHGYNVLINSYNKYLQERSRLLSNNILDESWLNELEKNISRCGLEIYSLREKQLNILVKNLIIYLNNFNLSFKINIKINDHFFENKLSQDLFEKELKNNRKIDMLTGGSKIGPHRSDYLFYANKNFLASQLSTGQQKTLILLIYLSHCKYLINIQNTTPILLLDEVCSHLDEINRNILLNLVESFNLQVFMTGTTKDLFSFLSTNTNFCNITNQ